MDHRQLIHKVDTAWLAFKNSFDGLTEAQMEEPGVAGGWSVRDIIAHVTAWEGEALKYLPYILRAERLPRYSDMYGGIDAFNNQVVAEKRALPLVDVLTGFEETHRRLLKYVQSIPEEHITTETRFRRRLRFDTYRHYAEHTEMIQNWRGRQV
jgi:hypothetical protein